MSNYDDYTAETARDKVAAHGEKAWRKEVALILSKIDEAAENGKRQVTVPVPARNIAAAAMGDLCDRGFEYFYTSADTATITW